MCTLVEFFFSGWGTPALPETVHDISDFFLNLEGEEQIPTWLLDMVHMLLDSKGEVYTDKMPIRMLCIFLFILYLTNRLKLAFRGYAMKWLLMFHLIS